MLTSSATERHLIESPAPSAVVVRLEPRTGPGRPHRDRPAVDADRLAHAVRDLIRAIDPGLRAEVRVEIASARTDLASSPTLRSAPPAEPRAEPRAEPDDDTDRSSDIGAHPRPHPDLDLDRLGRTLTVDGRAVVLTRREFDLLAYLHDRRGAALGRRELMTAVWQTGYLVGDRTIDVHVRRLRMKLGSQARRLTTLRGYGYRLD